MTILPNPFLTSPFDETAVLRAIADELDPPPAFLSDPSQEYLQAIDIMPIVEILQGYMR